MKFNTIESLKVIWTECNNDENLEFESFSDLDKYIKSCYPAGIRDIPSVGYDKFKISLSMKNDNDIVIPLYIGGCSRLDVGLAEGDFNPFRQSFRDELIKIYSKKDNTVSYTGDDNVYIVDFSEC